MPIVPLVNGATLQGVDISTMHAEVQALINSMPQGSLGRFTFNHDQLEHMCAGGGFEASSGSVNVTKELTTTDLTTAELDTTDMTKVLECAPGAIGGPAHVLIWVYWEITEWRAPPYAESARHVGVFGLGVEVDGGAIAFPNGRGAQGVIRARPYTGYSTEAAGGDPGRSSEWVEDEFVSGSMFAYYDGTGEVGPWDLDAITLWAGACKAGSATALAASAGTFFKVARANISWLAIRSA
jgi:hypothetical protein